MVAHTSARSLSQSSTYDEKENIDKVAQGNPNALPDDWCNLTIRSVCKLVNGRGFKPYEWKSRGLPIIRIQNLNGSTEFNYFDGTYAKKLEVENGQLLFAWSGSRGTSFGPHIWSGEKGLLNYHTWKVVVDNSKIDPSFFFHALKGLTKQIEADAHGASALVHTQKWQMEGFKFRAPIKQTEQKKLAVALSDADALIENLEKLIAKKRQIKQGAMQELLSGERRLPGYGGTWRTATLSEVGEILNGLTYSPSDVSDAGKLVLRSSNIQNDALAFNNDVFVNMDIPEKSTVAENDLLICVRNGSRDLIGKVARIDSSSAGMAFGAFMAVFRSHLHCFILHYFRSDMMKSQISSNLGATINQITNKSLKSFVINLPPTHDEANAIGNVLDDFDKEIALLQLKLSKTRVIKESMVQELLTGRIRLT